MFDVAGDMLREAEVCEPLAIPSPEMAPPRHLRKHAVMKPCGFIQGS